jgi:MFS family permease
MNQPPSEDTRTPGDSDVARQRVLTRAILALGITQVIGWGTLYYLPALFTRPIADGLDTSNAMVLGAFAWAMLISGLLSRRIGALIDRHGANRVMAMGSTLAAGALLIQASASSIVSIWASWTLLGLAMRAVLYDGAFAALTAIAGSQARRAISLLTLFGGLASSVFWPIGHGLLQHLDWRLALGVYAALNLLVCAPLHYWFAGASPRHHQRPGNNDHHVRPETTAAEHTAQSSPSDRETAVARERVVLLLAALFAFHSVISAAIAVHLPGLLQALGLSTVMAITAASLMGPAQVAARSIELLAQRRISVIALTVPVMAVVPVAFIPLMLAGHSATAALIFVVAYGATNGLSTILRGALPHALLGPRAYGELLGRIAAPGLVAGSMAPLALEWVITQAGPLAGVITLATIGLACTAIACAVVRAGRALNQSIR